MGKGVFLNITQYKGKYLIATLWFQVYPLKYPRSLLQAVQPVLTAGFVKSTVSTFHKKLPQLCYPECLQCSAGAKDSMAQLGEIPSDTGWIWGVLPRRLITTGKREDGKVHG